MTRSIRLAAMDLLARREHARKELRRKLLRRYPDEPAGIDEAIEQLSDEGLQSDGRMAESFIRSRVSRGQGPVKIVAELKARGVSEAAIDDAFGEVDVDWSALVDRVATSRFGDDAPADLREKARRSRFLQQRGFTFEHIARVLGD